MANPQHDWLRKPPKFSEATHRIQFQSRHCRGTVWPPHDIILNELLLWLLPTHKTTLLFKFIVVSGCINVVCVYPLWTVSETVSISMLGLAVCSWLILHAMWIWYYRRVLNELILAPHSEWMDPTIPAIHRLPMHVPMRLHSTEHDARRAACIPDLIALNHTGPCENKLTDNVWRMDTMPWRFCLCDDVPSARALVEVSTEGQPSPHAFRSIDVPANWTLQGVGDKPIYTNQKYPFPCQPPLVPSKNPTGVYTLDSFDVPEVWQTRDFDSSKFSLLFHGVESAFYLYINGSFVGFSKDSRLPAEFDITSTLRPANNTLHLVVARWSDGSYVEDQDHWWMAGIHRSVEMIRRPREATILDYQVQADASGHISCHVDLQEAPMECSTLSVKLFDDQQLSSDGDSWNEGDCLWACSKEIDSERLNDLTFSGTVPGIKLWSAEDPALYTFAVTLKTQSRVIVQSEACRVGFRTVDIQDGSVLFNGKAITFCGINRHEHDADAGKVVSLELMKKDICVMK